MTKTLHVYYFFLFLALVLHIKMGLCDQAVVMAKTSLIIVVVLPCLFLSMLSSWHLGV